MRLFVNPHTAQLMDWDLVPATDAPGGPAKFCPITRQPLNQAALEVTPYPGPAEDRDKWFADQSALMRSIQQQVNEPNAATLGVTVTTISGTI